MALPRNGTKLARVRIAARVAGGPSLPFLRRMPDAELALGLSLDLSEEVSNSSQVSRGSPEQRHPNYFWDKMRPGRNVGPLISVNIGRLPLPTKPAYSMTEGYREKKNYTLEITSKGDKSLWSKLKNKEITGHSKKKCIKIRNQKK